MSEKKTYTYCDVLPANYQSSYFYICDFDVKPGDIVIVPLRSCNQEKVGLVLDTNEYTQDNAPYPPQLTKHVIRAFGDDEPAQLVKEKAKVEAEKAVRFKSDDQPEKTAAKEALTKHGVGEKKTNAGQAQRKERPEKTPAKNGKNPDLITDLSGGIILSSDGKTVTGFKAPRTKGRVAVHIPSGVETIEDNAFLRVEIDSLFLPRELKYLGKYTINHPYGPYGICAKNIGSIVVEDGNGCFSSDGEGFYAIEAGKKKLLRLLNKSLNTYAAPEDVSSFEPDCFSLCPALKHIVLSEGAEFFDEYALPNDTQVKEVLIPKTVKHIRAKSMSGLYSEWNTVTYRIDEESPYLFRDEDSVYEVLEDGTYKLVTCSYGGKGKALFLEGTSVIGAEAFKGHKNITKLEFPKSLRVIEKEAFAETGLTSLVVPDYVQRIETMAFSRCDELKSVQLDPSLASIAEDAFNGCWILKMIKSEGKKKAFSFENGMVKKLAVSNQAKAAASAAGDSAYGWMAGKIFVHTGLSAADERAFEKIVNDNGGEVKSSTVLATDYLVYNADYDHETTKLRRARELQNQGKDIHIISFDAWNKMLETGLDGTQKAGPSASQAPVIPDKDYFAEFAPKIVQTITDESVSSKDRVSDRARFDAQKRVVSVITAFSQQSRDSNVVMERVACAEALKENDPVKIVMKGESWEVASVDGKSLGELGGLMARQAIPYMNFISICDSAVHTITPKSERRANCKYALGSVRFDITERQIPENMSEQDLITRTQFAYSVDDKEAHLIRWIGDASIKTAVIPAAIEGRPVISVNPGLFAPDMWTGIESRVEEIIVSEGVKRLEAETLFHVQNLKKIVLPASIEYISPDVFSDKDGQYRDLYLDRKTVYVAPAGSYAEKFLKDYKPDHYDVKVLMVVNDDSAEAADALQSLAALEMERNGSGFVAKFGRSMVGDFKLSTVKVPSAINGHSVETFDLYDIPNAVKKLVLPASIKTLTNMESDTLFYSSGQGLESVEVDSGNTVYSSDGKAIFSKDKKTLLRFMSYQSKEYSVPEGTETIGRCAFCKSRLLEKLTLPKTIRKIDSYAFCDCEKLEDILGLEYAAEVGENIFAGGGRPIPYVQKAPVIILGASLLKYDELSEKVIRVPDGITKICESAFGRVNENECVEEIILPASVQIIERAAFYRRSKLKKINIPEGVKEICRSTFACCEKLETLYIPASVEKIEISAFPKYMAAGSFLEEQPCAFKAVEVAPTNKNYCSINGMLLSKDRTKLLFVPNEAQVTGFVIPDGVTIVNDSLVSNNMALTELVLPDSVKIIGKQAFSGCGNLKKVVFPEGLLDIGECAFSGCTNLKTVVWPKNLKRIGNMAFHGCGLEEVTLPETLTHIGSKAFAETAIRKVTLPKSVRTLGWGAFSCVPEIEVYDSIDPDAKDADKGIDTVNGYPNSIVGYIGMGPARAMWECAANHRWVDYTITVRSAQTDEIKYKVWMGADGSQRNYYCFLSSAWGHNATFAFGKLDEFFPKIRGKENKLQVARYRLEYPYELSDAARSKYEAYVKKNS